MDPYSPNPNDPYGSSQPKGGSQFSDVSQYLTQNRDATNRLASNVGQQVVGAGNTARSDLSGVQNSFNQAANSSTVPFNSELSNRAATNPTSFFTFNPSPAQPTTTQHGPQSQKMNRSYDPTPTGVVNQNDLSALNAMRNATYTGPQDLTGQDGYGAAQTAANTAQNMAGQTGTSVGREGLLSSLYGGKPNVGASSLDSLLLNGSQAQGILGQAAGNNAGIGNSVNAANTAAQGTAAADAAIDANTAAQTNAAGQNAISSLTQRPHAGGHGSQAKLGIDQQQQLAALNRLYGVT